MIPHLTRAPCAGADAGTDAAGEEAETPDGLDSEGLRARSALLGTAVLVGSLYEQALIPPNILHIIIARFLDTEHRPVHAHVEAACELFATVRHRLPAPAQCARSVAVG